jgi:hypothetical protein
MTPNDQPSSEQHDEGANRPRYPWEDLTPERQRSNEEWVAQQFPWQTMSPEEYMARRGHFIQLCSLHRYPYTNPTLAKWMQRFGELLYAEEEELDRYRRQFLTPEGYAKVHEHIAAVMKECDSEPAPHEQDEPK